jgi:hypothetical protein
MDPEFEQINFFPLAYTYSFESECQQNDSEEISDKNQNNSNFEF